NIISGGAGDSSLAAEPVRLTYEALKACVPGDLARGSVSVEQIQVAYIIANAKLNQFLVAISIGAVFFGANTYIGNGPNFMVKSIADEQKVHTPTFLGFVFKFTLPCMLPVLIAVWWLFFRH